MKKNTYTKFIEFKGETCVATFERVDHGIGTYEYWGAIGVDSHMYSELLNLSSEKVDSIELTDEEIEQIEDNENNL